MPGNILARKSNEPGNLRKVYCKVITQVREYKGTSPFTEAFVIDMIIHRAKWVTDVSYNPAKKKLKTTQTNFSKEDAITVWRNMVRSGFATPAGRLMPDRLHPKVPQGGIQLWKADPYVLSECQEQSWYKATQRKREWKERHEAIDTQRCRAIRHLYALFGTSWFTYDMATSITKYMKQLSTMKSGEISERDKNVMRSVMQRFEVSSEEFRKIWNSLIRNNYITPWKKKTPTGYVQTNAYVINRQYLRKCMSAFEV
jgi:hypothetical protein